MSFDRLGLLPELLRAVADEGYTTPTPIQEQAIPLVLAGRDLLAAAQTGTGKTAAFVLPLLQLLHATWPAQELAPRTPAQADHGRQPRTSVRGMVRASGARTRTGFGGGRTFAPVAPQPVFGPAPTRVLVLVPTRELALQVEESVRTYGRHKPVGSVAIYGGVGLDPQVRALRAGAPIVVATPGRLLDHVGQGTIDLSRVTHLVLDEADRMLDMGFIRDIRRILELLPERRQNLLFSATFSSEIRSLAAGLLHDPASVEVAPRNTAAALIDQLVIPVDRTRKVALLTELFARGRVTQALVFARTKHGANRLAGQLEDAGIRTAAIHGNKSQPQRIRALEDFKAGRVSFLVATDIAARGIDIESLPHVVNFELPMVAEDYVHRIGRTGRAGVDGQAISLVCVDEAPLLRDIQALLRRTIPSETIQGFEPDRTIAAEPIRLRSGEVGRGGRGGGRFGGSRPAPGGRPGGTARPAHLPAPAAQPPRTASGWSRPTPPIAGTRLAPETGGRPTPVRPAQGPSSGEMRPVRQGEPGPGQSRRQSAPEGPRPLPQPRHAGRPTGSHRGQSAGGGRSNGEPARIGFGNRPIGGPGRGPQPPAAGRPPVAMPGERLRRAEPTGA